MFGFFGPSEETQAFIIKGLRTENASLTKEVKSLKKQHEADDERWDEYREMADKRERKFFKEQEESNRDYLALLAREQRDAIEEAEDSADDRVRASEKECDKKVREAEAKVQNTENAVKTAVLKEKETNLAATTKLEVAVAVAKGEASASEARAEAAEAIIETIQELMETGAENAQTTLELVIGKIAEVKLDKFQVNVDVPAPVMVNGAPQKQNGGEQKKQ